MIKKRGSTYWLDFRIGKKRFRRSLKTDEHGLALERAREIKQKLLQAQARSDITFADFAAQYLEWAWTNKPASTRREEQRIGRLKNLFQSLNILYLADITPWHIEQIKAKLKTDGRSPTTINHYLQLLRGMLYRATDWGLYAGPNPLRKVKFLRGPAARRLLTDVEVGMLLDTAKAMSVHPWSPVQRIFYDLMVLAINAGLRRAEALNLRWHDVTPDGLHIIGKGGKARTVPLNRTAAALIDRQPRRSEYVFHVPNRDKETVFRRTTSQISKQTGIHFHYHLLRHYFASRLLARGVDIVTVGEILGHSKIATTLVYSHTDPARKQHAVDVLMDTGQEKFSDQKC